MSNGNVVARSGKKFYPITNHLVFGRIFSDPDNVRPLLEEVLGVPIGEIRYVESEHSVDPSLHGKGVRMDVFVNDGSGAVYDVEMQNTDDKNLALRSRYLLSSFDRDRIERGDDYIKLGQSVVIFVCGFDPFDYNRRVYAVRPMVIGTDLVLEDKTLRVFLNAKGAANEKEEGDMAGGEETAPSQRLSAFLSYVDGGGTMGDEWVALLDKQVQLLNADEGWRDTMLSYEMIMQDEKRASRAEGLELGRAEGLELGRAEGLELGRKEVDELNRLLAEKLHELGREQELVGAMLDPSARNQLLEELGIVVTAE